MGYLVRSSLAGLLALMACDRVATPPRPQLSALLAAGDSTFWITTRDGEAVLRRSPMLVSQVEGRLVELYVTDEDLTHDEALLVGQRVFRRDLVTGDSVLVRYDTSIAAIASRWLARHPGARRLAPDEDPVENPATQATTDVSLLDAVGPWLSVESRIDVDAEGEPHQHMIRRGVIDLRTGLAVKLTDLVAPSEARRLDSIGRLQLAAAVDSIKARRDVRAARARATVPSLVFDATSFEVTSGPVVAAVSFLVPGRGEHAGGYALPLADIPRELTGARCRDGSSSALTR